MLSTNTLASGLIEPWFDSQSSDLLPIIIISLLATEKPYVNANLGL